MTSQICHRAGKRFVAALILLALALSAPLLRAGTAAISIDVSKPGPRLNPRMYGIFLEEINHGVDGGLYAGLIRNPGFEDGKQPEGFNFRDGRRLDGRGYCGSCSQVGYFRHGL